MRRSRAELDLPPPFTLVTLREVGDAFAHAVAIAPEQGAGTLVYVGRFDLAEFAVVLEPDEPLRTRAARALSCGMVALIDALLAHAPPEKPIAIDWPDAIRVDGGLVGGGRLAWPEGASEDEPPEWLVFGAMIRTVSMSEGEPGLQPAGGGAGGGRLHRFRRRRAGRELRAPPDGASSTPGRSTASRAVAKEYLQRLPREKGVRRDIDENGDLLMRRIGKVEVERRKLVPRARRRRPGSIRNAAGRAREADPHHPARSVRHVRVRARRRAGRMGGVGRVRVLERGRREARRQGALGVPRRVPRRRVARLVDAGADRRGERGGPRGAGRAAGAAAGRRISARPTSRRRAPRPRRRSRSRPRSAIIRPTR